MSRYCSTCLSEDRELKHVDSYDEIKTTLVEWFSNNSCYRVNVDRFKVCWECYAMFLKLSQFKQQVFNSQQIRLNNQNKKLAHLKQSKLSVHSNKNYDAEYVFEDEDDTGTVVEETKKSKRKIRSRSHTSKSKLNKAPDPDPAPIHSNSQIEKAVDEDDVIEILTCNPCKSSFEGKAAYRAHMVCTHKYLAQVAYCTECNMQFESLEKFQRHVTVHNMFEHLNLHRVSGSSGSSIVNYSTCALCKEPANKIASLILRGPSLNVNGNLCTPCLRKLQLEGPPQGCEEMHVNVQMNPNCRRTAPSAKELLTMARVADSISK